MSNHNSNNNRQGDRNDKRTSRFKGFTHDLDLSNWMSPPSDHVLTRRSRPPSMKNEHHLLARAQFVVFGNSVISSNIRDVDKGVNWGDVIQIRKYIHSIDFCPICLCEPQLAKIIKCGHVFCTVCLRELYTHFDGNYSTCPVCNDYVKKDDSKPVKYIKQKKYSVGDIINMRLMKRLRNDVLCRPASDKVTSDSFPKLGEEISSYSRIITADDYLTVERLIYKPFMSELVSATLDCCDEHSLFIAEEISLLELNMERTKSILSDDAYSLDLRRDCDGDYVYFYQTADGQNIFLHSFNIKCLKGDYSHLENCPHSLKGHIVALDSFIITEENRSMWKFLSHLPLSSKFYFAELDLSCVLSFRSSQNNREEMIKRAQFRYKKEMREEHEMEQSKLRAEKVQDFCRISTETDVQDLSDTSLFPILPQSMNRPKPPVNRITYAQAVGNSPVEVSSTDERSVLYEMCLSAKNKKSKSKK